MSRSLPWFLPLSILLIYLCFPTRNYYWDGISFASSIENSAGLSKSLIHPHHLLYNVFGYGVYRLTQLAGLDIRAVEILQISNGVLSASCAWLLFRFLNRTLRSPYVSTLLTLVFSFSATWWKYSTDADAYIPSVLFLLVCLNLLLTVEKVRPFLLALVHTASMCLHQLAVFFYPVVVVGILLQRTRYSLRERVRLVLQYSATAAATTLAINYYCFHLHTGSFGLLDFARWLTSYVQGPNSYSLSFDVLPNLGLSLRGQVRLLFAGRLNWIQGLVSFPVIVLMGILIGLVLTISLRLFKALPKVRLRLPRVPAIEERFKPVAGVCAVWLIVYLAFLFIWYPYFTPYRMFYLAPLVGLFGVLLVQKEWLGTRRQRTTASMLVAAMAISNFVFFILPLSHSEKYPPLSFALKMNDIWASGTVVYYAKSNADNQLIRYFNPSSEWRTLKLDSEELIEDQLEDSYRDHKTAWIETSAMDQMKSRVDGAAWLSAHTRNGCRQELINSKYRIEFVQVFPIAVATKKNSDCSLMAYVHEDTFK